MVALFLRLFYSNLALMNGRKMVFHHRLQAVVFGMIMRILMNCHKKQMKLYEVEINNILNEFLFPLFNIQKLVVQTAKENYVTINKENLKKKHRERSHINVMVYLNFFYFICYIYYSMLIIEYKNFPKPNTDMQLDQKETFPFSLS